MMRVKQILDDKGGEVYSIDMNACVLDAIKLMAEKEIGALVVKDGHKLAGIISERDYTRKVILRGRTSQQTKIEEIMATNVVTVHPRQTITECMSLMTQHRIRHLPVTDGQRLIGLLSIGDLVKAIIEEQQLTIEQLQNYIRG